MIVNDSESNCLAVVLAAGEGTRMRSAKPKVLHELAGRPMLAHSLDAIAAAGIEKVALVVGPGHEEVAALAPNAQIFTQTERRGTAHAVLTADLAIAEGCDVLLVAFGDTPLVRPETFAALRLALKKYGAAVAVLGFDAADPTGYGRLIMDGTKLLAIREEKDANDAQRALTLCNAGLMALDGRFALPLLRAVRADNQQREFYLTDVVELARKRAWTAVVVRVPESEVLGVNDRVQLGKAEAAMQIRLREAAMRAGATFIDPASVMLTYDTRIGPDAVVEPYVVFGHGVSVGAKARIRSFSHLEGVTIGERALVGPFARLRPGTEIGADVHVGNFVEIKASTLAQGVKANHLSYIGDATIGARTNVGAGTITCNYDGFSKARTQLGAGVFVGSHSSLVAPVTVGDGAYIGTGSVVTENVAPDALVVARARQVEKPGWAKQFRASKGAREANPETKS